MKYRKIIKRINGASVEGFEPVKSSLVTKIFIGIGLLVGLFVII